MSSKKTIIAGLFGNALEWYDFTLYASFAPLIANLFFPEQQPSTAILLTFAVFALGFLIRPIGALIFGYIGDHLGRRTALITSMSLISVPTLGIGLLPSYSSIGFYAPAILTLLRMLQGIAVSGELNSATSYLLEHAADNRRGLMGSLVMNSAFFGIFLGVLLSFIISVSMSAEMLQKWGWRIPFCLGGLIGLLGLYLRIQTKESPKFLERTDHKAQQLSIKTVFQFFKKNLLLSFCLTSIMAVGNYIFIAYVVSFLVKFQGFSMQEANFINLTSLFVMLLVFPIVGWCSDRWGRKPVFKMGLWGFMLLSLPIFWLLSQPQFALILAGDILLALVLVPIAALIPTLLAELFPTEIRNSGSALGYNLCLTVFGGTAPPSRLNFAATHRQKLCASHLFDVLRGFILSCFLFY